jgi:hypothetical protein
LFNTVKEVDKKYTKKVEKPQYLPSDVNPNLTELYDMRKHNQLIADINKSNISDDEKKFLQFAATRHIIFNYSKIADYYAHADREMQELMEKSALVIIDIDDAIANGYVKLSKDIKQILEESGDDTNKK